jgi:hypothetical protein
VKKTYLAVIASGLVIALVMGGSRLRARAGSSGIPLSDLAGSFAGEAAANYAVCFNSSFSAAQSCSTTPQTQIVPFVDNGTFQVTSDAQGNACGEEFEANAPLFPGPQPAGVNHFILVRVTTSYNPATGSGNNIVKGYIAKHGVGCHGASFVNTAGEPVDFTVKEHFVVSQNGNRSDAVALTVHTTSPVDFLSGFVGHSFALRQTQSD